MPFHASTPTSPLLRAGYKVAICDQIEDPALAKGLVRRAVTEVLTPGTALVPALLPERDSHYALCIAPGDPAPEARAGFAYLDFSTGEFALGERPASELLDVVARYAPGEVFLPRAALGSPFETALRRRFETLPVSFRRSRSRPDRDRTLTRPFAFCLPTDGCSRFARGSRGRWTLSMVGRLKRTPAALTGSCSARGDELVP